MPLHEQLTRVAGFVVENGKPLGTCFRVLVPSEVRPNDHRFAHSYLITAAHCVPSEGHGEVWMPTVDGGLGNMPGPIEWTVHPSYAEDPETGMDIAAARAYPESQFWFGLPLDEVAVDRAGIIVELGADIYYFGLLAPVGSMAKRGQSMVRGATFGARDAENVSYIDDRTGSSHLASRAQLIDCRSLGGFSGSPCMVESKLPGPPIQRGPELYRSELTRHRPELRDIDFLSMHYFYALFGMLVAYADYDGVGVVLPIECIHEIVGLEDFVTKRHEDDEELARVVKDKDAGFRATSARSSDRERVSLDGDFEDVLKALFNTPAHPDTE